MAALSSEILREIGALSRSIQMLNDHEFRRSGLQKGQFIFVTRICENVGISHIELSNLLKVDKTTTTKAVQKLAEAGFVQKKRDDKDKRVWRLFPARKALDLYPRIIAEENGNIGVCCAGLKSEERAAALGFLRKMRENIENRWMAMSADDEPKSPTDLQADIIEYAPEYQEGIAAMILDIQREEYGIPITLAGQPDLLDIENFYLKNGDFWVAVHGGAVVGTVAVKKLANSSAVIRKMFVRQDFRGKDKAVSGRLLSTLLDWARRNSLKKLYLGTTPHFLAAHRFYEKNGFKEIGEKDLPSDFPLMSVDKKFFMYTL